MHSKFKKLAAILLAFTMVFSLLPVSAFADDEEAEIAAVEPEVIVTETEEAVAEEVPAEETPEEAPEEPDAEPIVIEGELMAEDLEALPVIFGRGSIINPLYRDSVSESDIVYPAYPNPFANLMADTGTDCYSSFEAAVAVRSGMRNRAEEIEVAIHSGTMLFNSEETFDEYYAELEPIIFAHTGVPTEGDYIKWAWKSIGFALSITRSNGEFVHRVTLFVSYNTSAAQENEVNSRVAELCQTLARDTDFETIRAVYDYVCSHVTYDYDNLEDDSYRLKYTAYAALIDGTAVCQGYALLMYRLLLEEGIDIDCRLISGIGNGGPHGWNIVKLGDCYYDIDATWDAGQTNYSYFLTCEETFTENYTNHYRDAEYATAEFMAAYPMSLYDYDENIVTENGIIYYIEDDMAVVAGCSEEIESLVIPEYVNGYPVVGIVDEAFVDNGTLTEVHISDGVQYIGDWAFRGCWNLLEVELPDSLAYLGEGAFGYCSSLTSVEIPDGLKVISADTFHECYNLTSVTIPQSVTSIGKSAFSGTRLLEINYDGNILSDVYVAADNYSLAYADNSAGDRYRAIVNENWGIVWIDNGNISVYCTNGNAPSAMPDYDSAEDAPWYPARAYIDHVIIMGSITSIGAHAFEHCYNLVDVTAEDGVVSVGESAFNGCFSLYALNFTNSVTTIGNNAFAECTGLSEVYFTGSPAELQSIEIGENNDALAYVTVYFDENGNSGLCGENVMWSIEDGVLTISGTGEMFDYSAETPAPWSDRTDEITAVVIGDGVTHIGNYAFYNCGNVMALVATNSLTSIGTSAFGNCPNLVEVYFDGSAEDIGAMDIGEDNDTIFYTYFYLDHEGNSGICGDTALWYFDDGVLTISGMGTTYDYASADQAAPWFRHSEDITAVVIENGITSICDGTFAHCSNLVSVEIPATVTAIGEGAFAGCTSLTDVYYDGTRAEWNRITINNTDADNTPLFEAEIHCKIAIVITAQPVNITVNEWETAKFAVTATGTGLTYQWQYKTASGTTWKNCPSTTDGYNAAEIHPAGTMSRNGHSYRCIITDAAGDNVTSDAAKLTVIAGATITITKQPVNITVNEGETAKFTVAVADTGLHYQWQYKTASGTTWKNCPSTTDGYNAAELHPAGTMSRNGYSYRCVISNGNGNSVTSNTAKLTVIAGPALSITNQPVNITVNEGETAKFTVTATGTGLTYQWQYKTASGTTWKNCPATTDGYNAAELHPAGTMSRNGHSYRCVITDASGNKVTSDSATLTVIAFGITKQPVNITVNEGETAKITVTATGTGLTYQWQYKTASGTTWKNCTATTDGYNTAELQPAGTMGRNGHSYRCVITDASGNKVTSSAAKLTVIAGHALSITQQPVNITVNEGETAKITVTATGTGLTYQWQYKTASGTTWKNCTATTDGYNTAELQPAGTMGRNGHSYRCVITDASGNKVTSSAAKLTVIAGPALSITQHPVNITVNEGETAKFTVTATGTGLTYQWQYKTASGTTWKNCPSTTEGYNAAELHPAGTTSRNGHSYRCVITDASGNKVTSDAAILTVS